MILINFRFEWSHGICPRMNDVIPVDIEHDSTHLELHPRQQRISFTFRKIREGECYCSFPIHCDSQKKGKFSKISLNFPEKI